MSKILKNETTACIEWLWWRDRDGYGSLWHDGKNVRAHRLSYCMNKNIPLEDIKGLCVCHKCDNPGCVNPDHLFLGSNLDNIKDRTLKGRSAKGESNGRNKLSKKDVLKILSLKGTDTQRNIGKLFGVSNQLVSRIHNGGVWNV